MKPYSKKIVKIIKIKYKNLINIKNKPYILSYLNKKLRDFNEHYLPRTSYKKFKVPTLTT